MTGRLRYILAAAFVALFFLIPTANPEELALLKTRAWLTGKDGPFANSLRDGKMPPFQVLIEHQGQQDWIPRYERLAREWARSKKTPIDDSLAAITLKVLVGDNGFLCEFFAPNLEKELQLELKKTSTDDYYPDRYSLAPAFSAIIFAIITGWVIPALFLGCLIGAWLYMRMRSPEVVEQLKATADHLFRDTIWTDVLQDTFSLEIMGFVVFLFMSVGVMTRSGGIHGLVQLIQKFARGPVSSQLCSFVVGLLIFFDDYSNCVITGTTMRPLTDRNRVSREKLSYIVDSTAAPIAGISIFSTWVAYEVSMFKSQLPEVTDPNNVPYTESQGFLIFVETLPYRFYCIFTLAMVLLTIVLRREFGPMLDAERRTLKTGEPSAEDASPMVSKDFEEIGPDEGTACRARNVLIPVGTLVLLSLVGIFYLGYTDAVANGETLRDGWFDNILLFLEYSPSQRALCWSAAAALVVASIMVVFQRLLTVGEVAIAALRSVRALGFAVIILILAWTIGKTCEDVGTNYFLTAAFGNNFDYWLLPVVFFLLASLVAFSTGTSYGTMAILLPNIVVLSHTIGSEVTIGGPALMILTIGAVLEGSIFGDHCSPISDTTVLSSVATGSDHLHHVRTQAPYAFFVMIVSTVCGYLPMALLGPQYWVLSWIAGITAIVLWLLLIGKRPDRGLVRAKSRTPAATAEK